ncbi:hypothetical protein [Bdellovibrio sp. HCB209]|uniref:hypothetical protein n=1 Tax=Bdellovibrio sp. HCB209 TaxID=3394354 RepID=UPI0039B39821
MKQVSTLFILLILSSVAQAFDRMNCDSDLGNWTVHNSIKGKSETLSATTSTAYLKRDQSMMLIVRDDRKKDIAIVSPWNDIQFFEGKKIDKSKYKFDFKTDRETQFTLNITDSAKKVHSLSCKMTF